MKSPLFKNTLLVIIAIIGIVLCISISMIYGINLNRTETTSNASISTQQSVDVSTSGQNYLQKSSNEREEKNKRFKHVQEVLHYKKVFIPNSTTTALSNGVTFTSTLLESGIAKNSLAYIQIVDGVSESVKNIINNDIAHQAHSSAKSLGYGNDGYCEEFWQQDSVVYVDSVNLILSRSYGKQCGMPHPESESFLHVYDLKTGERIFRKMKDKTAFNKAYSYFLSVDTQGDYFNDEFNQACNLKESFEKGLTYIMYGGVTDKGILLDIHNSEGFPKFQICHDSILVPQNVVSIDDFSSE